MKIFPSFRKLPEIFGAHASLPNFEPVGQKLQSLGGVKVFNKTGNRKISAFTICPKIGGNSRGVSADVLAKFKENRIRKFQSIAILRKIHLAPSSDEIYQNFS